MARKGKIVIGIGGNAGSGKSELARVFKDLGAGVINADRIGWEVLRQESVKEKLVKRFGRSIIDGRGDVIRSRLGRLVFSNPRQRRYLNRVVHPKLLFRIRKRIRSCPKRIVVLDAALLFDWKIEPWFDWTILVTAPQALKEQRLVKNGLSRGRAHRLLGGQMKPGAARRKADIVIRNTGSLGELRRQGKRLWRGIVP